MDSKSLVFYAKDNSDCENDISRHIETVTNEDPLEEILNIKTIKHSTLLIPTPKQNNVEEKKVCNKPKDDARSTNDGKETVFSVDKAETSTQPLLDEYKYCKDVISFITSKNCLDNLENQDPITKPPRRDVNDVFIFTITEDRTNCFEMNETKYDYCSKPCDESKPSDASPKPCDALQHCDTSKPCETSKPCNALKPIDTSKPCDASKPGDASKPCDATESCYSPKTCESCSERKCQSQPEIAPRPSLCNETTSKTKIICCPKTSDSPCNVQPAESFSSKPSQESSTPPESQLGDCIMKCLESIEAKKSADVSAKSSKSDTNSKPCSFQNVPITPPEVPPCPNKSSPTSSFQNFVVSSATRLAAFKESIQDFIVTVCDTTRKTTKFVTDEGFKALGFQESPKCNNSCKDCDPNCTNSKKCDYSKENESNNIEISEVKTAIHMYDEGSCKTSTSISGVLEGIVDSKMNKSSKYDHPKNDETSETRRNETITFTELLRNMKDKVVSYIMNPLADTNCVSDEGGSGKSDINESCHSDVAPPHHIIIVNNNQAENEKDAEGKGCEKNKNNSTET